MQLNIRRNAREFAVQAIYSWQLSKNNISDIGKDFFIKNKKKNMTFNIFTH